jgi:uncharacterized protein YjaZ
MNNLALHFVNQLPQKLLTITKQAAAQAQKIAQQNLKLKHYLNLIIADNLQNTIPEQGVSGTTLSDDLIIIYLDPHSPRLTQNTIYTTICHELNHTQRWHLCPKFDNRLLGSLILEGLAVAFEEEAVITKPEFFLKTIQNRSQVSSKKLLTFFKPELLIQDFPWDKKRRSYFVTGNKKLGLPRWAGYQVGYYLVKQHMAKTGKKASELIDTPAADFIK